MSAEAVSLELRNAIAVAADNIRSFHSSQLVVESAVETMPGVSCWRKNVPIERVGLYVPGGTAPLLSTVLMLGIPAKLAGCKEVVLCTPPGQKGVDPAIAYAALECGIDRIFTVGGIQAIAAMTLGTETVPKVDKIFGPGNQYVTAAKQFALGKGVAIDMPAGPSELMIIADSTAVPAYVAADALSQAEHGPDSQVVILTWAKELIPRIKDELRTQLDVLPRREIASQALDGSSIVLVNDREDAMTICNDYAPEHLILSVDGAEDYAQQVVNAGSVFIGNFTPESAGDYASGTNHTLPTNGYARAYSGVSMDSFVKKITYQRITEQGLRELGPSVEVMAQAEQLEGHRRAVRVRISK